MTNLAKFSIDHVPGNTAYLLRRRFNSHVFTATADALIFALDQGADYRVFAFLQQFVEEVDIPAGDQIARCLEEVSLRDDSDIHDETTAFLLGFVGAVLANPKLGRVVHSMIDDVIG